MDLAVRDTLLGATVGDRYRVGARIARGGMATVYRATDLRLDREVALKVVHPHLAESPEFLARLQLEARAAARLSHPATVAVGDQGVDAGPSGVTAWLTMELLPGGTLRDVIEAGGPHRAGEVVRVMRALLSGLGAAHAAGIVHRDVKPENVLASGADPDGPMPGWKVADFGLARALAGSGSLTHSVLGTPAYMAPELARDGRVDGRVDLYSAGIVLFELLTGRQPFVADNPLQVVMAHIDNDVPAVSSVTGRAFGAATDEVDSLVAWACARDPELRPVDAGDLLAELDSVFAAVADEVGPDAPLPPRSASAGRGSGPGSMTGAPAGGPQWFDTLGLPPGPTAAEGARDAQPSPDHSVLPPPPGRATNPTLRLTGAELARVATSSPVAPPVAPPPGPRASVTGRAVPGPAAPPDAGVDPDLLAGLHDDVDGPDIEVPAVPDRGHPGRGRRTGSSAFRVRPGATRRRRDQALGLVLLAAMVVSLVVAGVVWWAQVGPGAYERAPEVVGLEADAAAAVLAERGFEVEVGEVHDETVPVGTVVESRPGPGQRVRKAGTVAIDVSLGPPRVEMPAVVGLPSTDAVAVLTGNGFSAPTVTEVHDPAVPAGIVISSDPPAETQVVPEVASTLTVSLGPEPIGVPGLVGKERAAAQEALTGAGLVLGAVTEQNDPAIPAGVVISQTPDGGTLLPGQAVDVVVSLGPPPVTVRDVRNLTTAEATGLLEGDGFRVERSGTQFLDRVFQQYPEPGTQQPPGSTVVITTF